jgi:hypothetical protein
LKKPSQYILEKISFFSKVTRNNKTWTPRQELDKELLAQTN